MFKGTKLSWKVHQQSIVVQLCDEVMCRDKSNATKCAVKHNIVEVLPMVHMSHVFVVIVDMKKVKNTLNSSYHF